MMLSLHRGGRLLPQSTQRPRHQLCIRCCIRLQHSDAAERLSYPPDDNDGQNNYSINGEQGRIRHPPRKPRTYVVRPQPENDSKFQSFGFMRPRPSLPLPSETRQAFPDRSFINRPAELPIEPPKELPVKQKPFEQASTFESTEQSIGEPIYRPVGRNSTELGRITAIAELQKDIRQLAVTIRLRPAIVSSIGAFLKSPFIPTQAQQTLLYSLVRDSRHIFFRAETGSGKSFILAMHSLNLSRSTDQQNQPTTTTLILVPDSSLAIQYQYWITQILGSSIKDRNKISRIVQAIYRTTQEEENQQKQKLREFPNPHVIISTPTRMLDLISESGNTFDFDNLKCIILDEADEIIQPPKTTVETKKIYHRAPGEILLDWIYQKRGVSWNPDALKFIAISATLTTSFESYINTKGWFDNRHVEARTLQSPSAVHPTPDSSDHHVILVSLKKSPDPTRQPDQIRIQPAQLPKATLHDNVRVRPPLTKDAEPPSSTEYPPNYLSIPAMQRILRETSTKKALAIIPHGASKTAFVWACHYFGLLGAQQLLFSLPTVKEPFLEHKQDRRNVPLLYVASPKEIRGLDLKGIEMVFIMGEFGTVEDYVHITGRTGRRRTTHGNVVTILEDTMENLGQKMMNAAVKLVRTGSKLGTWMLSSIEMDLKPLPGDEFEEIRNKAGIVTFTEEIRQKEERERKTFEEQKKWLLMEGVDDTQLKRSKEEDMVGDNVERPESFGMGNLSVVRDEIEEEVAPESVSMDWKEALAETLRKSSTPVRTSQEPNVIIGGLDPPESLEDLSDEEIVSERESEPALIENGPLPPFASKPPFPHQQYRAAWKDIKNHYDKAREENTASSIPSSTEPASILPESLPSNEAVLPPQDVPISPHDINLSFDSSQNALQPVLEGESLRQIEESHLFAPNLNQKRKKTSERKRNQKKEVGEKNGKRGRPRKDTSELGA